VNNNSTHGGARPGAGRKPKADELNLINTMDSIISPDEVWYKVSQLAMSGDMQALKVWIEYRFGKAKQSVDITSGGEKLPTLMVEVVRPNES
jgi:hypothetical protein